jgi:hypothetical protein
MTTLYAHAITIRLTAPETRLVCVLAAGRGMTSEEWLREALGFGARPKPETEHRRLRAVESA